MGLEDKVLVIENVLDGSNVWVKTDVGFTTLISIPKYVSDSSPDEVVEGQVINTTDPSILVCLPPETNDVTVRVRKYGILPFEMNAKVPNNITYIYTINTIDFIIADDGETNQCTY